VLCDRLLRLALPRPWWWVIGGAVVAVVGGIAWAMWRRPGAHDAAVAIDVRLGLKEKFSTALYVRSSDDPFARAAVRDAERTAERVSLHKQFPLTYPARPAGATIAVVILSLLCLGMIKQPLDLLGREAARRKQAIEQQKQEESRKILQTALAQVESVPATLAKDLAIQNAQRDLSELLKQPPRDPTDAQRTAIKALSDVNQAIAKAVAENQKYADAQQTARMFTSLQPPAGQQGPVADAHRAVASGNFSQAASDLQNLANEFQRMNPQEQQKAIEQMKQLALQLQNMANDPQQQQQLEDKLKQMGADDKQAKEMAQQMQKAAQGDQNAIQQLQDQQKQLMQAMNNGQGPTQAQQQQIQEIAQQLQAQTNAQQQANQLAQGAQQMASAMQQVQQTQQQQQPGGQQGQQQQSAQSPQAGQQMAQAQQQLQQALSQIQAIQNDAQQVAAAQQSMQAAQQQAAGQQQQQQQAAGAQGGQQSGQQSGQQAGQAGGQQSAQQGSQMAGGQMGNNGQGGAQQPGNSQNGQWGANGQGPGQNGGGQWAPNGQVANNAQGGGQASGDRPMAAFAPGTFKPEYSPSQDQEKGKVLASTFVKADALKGESKAQLQQVLNDPTRQPDQTDEIDQQRISRQDQEVVKDYFRAIQEDAAK